MGVYILLIGGYILSVHLTNMSLHLTNRSVLLTNRSVHLTNRSVHLTINSTLRTQSLPLSATLSTVVFSCVARKPRKEKMTKPAKNEVRQFPIDTIRVSLKKTLYLYVKPLVFVLFLYVEGKMFVKLSGPDDIVNLPKAVVVEPIVRGQCYETSP